MLQITLSAQHSVNTSGGNISNSNGSVSYSVGQLVYSSYANSYGKLAEGVQQPYEWFAITSVFEAGDDGPAIFVFPNPVKDHLRVLIAGIDPSILINNYSFILSDLAGKTLKSGMITGETFLVDMSGKPAGNYFLQLFAHEKLIGVYKIIKK